MVHFGTSLVLAASLVAISQAAPTTESKFVSVPIRRPKVASRSAKDLIARERVRAFGFRDDACSTPAVNTDVTYTTATIVGNQTFELIVDTGSSNTWVGANTYFDTTGSTDTGDSTFVEYGSGIFFGEEYIASVTLGGLTVPSQYVGDAEFAYGFSSYDGIIGFGPVDLTEGTVGGIDTVPTFLDNLYSQGSIHTEVLGVSFAPESGSDTDDDNGELTLGGVDDSKYTGSITYAPKSTVSLYSYYWSVDTTSISYGSTSLQGAASAIVDTGTTLIYIPEDGYNAFLSASNGTTDGSTGFAAFTAAPTENFTITIAGTDFPLSPAQYLVPEAQYSNFGLSSGTYYAWINDGGSSDPDFIIGQKFLENYYSVFDTTNSQIGFAQRA